MFERFTNKWPFKKHKMDLLITRIDFTVTDLLLICHSLTCPWGFHRKWQQLSHQETQWLNSWKNKQNKSFYSYFWFLLFRKEYKMQKMCFLKINTNPSGISTSQCQLIYFRHFRHEIFAAWKNDFILKWKKEKKTHFDEIFQISYIFWNT